MRDLRNLQGLTICYASCLPRLIVTQIGPNDKLRRDTPEFFRNREVLRPRRCQEDPTYSLCHMKIMQK